MTLLSKRTTPLARPAPLAAGRPNGIAHPTPSPSSRARVLPRAAAHVPSGGPESQGAPFDLSTAPGHVPRPLDLHVVTTDFLVVGSGIAGLSYALKVAEHGRVVVLTKGPIDEGSTKYAQGGICAVLDPLDSVEAHVQDTLVAGCFLNDPKAVRVVCAEGARRVMELVDLWGAQFTRDEDRARLHLTREGGHSHRRIVHAADATGREIERALVASVRAHPNITVLEDHLAVDLVMGEVGGVRHCLGVDALPLAGAKAGPGALTRYLAYATMIASGGAGQVYQHTTNPTVVTGDGIAMAFRAGAAASNLEFVQFHPTGMYEAPGDRTDPNAPAFLITEAVRGEGGVLLNQAGERFMPAYDVRLELAPRDVVARAIADQMTTRGEEHVWLDISHKPASFVRSHFPNVAARCLDRGIDITQQPIPVTPVQHYLCGGVHTGLLADTSVPGLYACGEAASSGLHGANRLASNSLLEGLVFAHRAVDPSVAHAEYVAARGQGAYRTAAAAAMFHGPSRHAPLTGEEAAWCAGARAAVRRAMWEGAGITRSVKGLARALAAVTEVAAEVRERIAGRGATSPELQELLNLATVGCLVVRSALRRKESRGGHYVKDYPGEVEAERRPTLIQGDRELILPGGKKAGPVSRPASAAGGKFTARGARRLGSPARDRAPSAREGVAVKNSGRDSE